MSSSSGFARKLLASRMVRFKDLMDLRGNVWDPMNDFFFGLSTVDYDWSDPNDINRLTKWVYTQEGSTVGYASVDATKHELTIGQTLGNNPLSNQRELWTIPETATWGIAHAFLEIKNNRYSGSLNIKPQHGLGMRAQEDTGRRAIIIWHDVASSIANAINIGVWQGDLAGGNFYNRQGNGIFDITEILTPADASRVGGVVTCITTVPNSFIVGDYIDANYTREFASVAISRAANIVTATVGSGHQFQTGDTVALKGSSPASFDGTFTLTGVTTTQVTWAQSGINESGTATVSDKSSDVSQVVVQEVVNNTTFKYIDGKHDLTSLETGGGMVTRLFPYNIEVKLDGSVVMMRCWGRHQARPAWANAIGRGMVVDLDKVHKNLTVTAISRTGGIATATVGIDHDCVVGNRINIDVTDASFDTTNGFVSAVNATQVSYPNPGPDTASGGTGTGLRVGGGDATNIATAPTPKGSGRIAIVAAHMGTQADALCRYGDMYGDNSGNIQMEFFYQSIETEVAQPVARAKIKAIGQSIESELAQPIVARKVLTVGQVVEGEIAQPIARAKVRAAGQVVETEIAQKITAQPFFHQVVESEIAQPVARTKVKAVTQAIEAEVAQVVARSKARTAGQVVETELAQVVARTKQLALAQVIETELAQVVARSKVRALSQATETELAQTITRAVAALGQVIETELAQPITATKIKTVAQAVESEIAQTIARSKSRTVLPATEAELAQVIARTKMRTLAQAIETELAQQIVVAGHINQVIEVEIARPFTVSKIKAVGQAVEAEMAQAISRIKMRTAGQVIEVELAQPFKVAPIFHQVIETEIAQPFTVIKRYAVGQAVEQELAQIVRTAHAHVVGQVTEQEISQAFGRTKRYVIAQVTETESGMPIVRFIPDVTHPSGVGTGATVVRVPVSSRHGAHARAGSGRVRKA